MVTLIESSMANWKTVMTSNKQVLGMEDIKMKFGIDNCAVLELERGRLVRNEGIELPDGERMKEVDQKGYKHLVVLQLDKVMNKEMKESI